MPHKWGRTGDDIIKRRRITMENKNVNDLDVIALTRELGKKIQAEDVFVKYQLAKQNADNDAELQKIIGAFSDKRTELSEESGKPENDSNKELPGQEIDLPNLFISFRVTLSRQACY